MMQCYYEVGMSPGLESNPSKQKTRTAYTYHSQPKIVSEKPQYRPPEEGHHGNIMYDRRVVRGPTYVHHPIPTQTAESQASRQAEARRRAMARRRAQTQRARNLRLRMGTPPPVEGRKHKHLQTHEYLEDLFDNPPEVHEAVQTDVFLDRPPTPSFTMEIHNGIDVGTQIYPGELFHFDTEVRPVLEVLVGKTIEQSLVEVFEEDETMAIKKQQELLRELRDSELAEEQRLAELERRRKEQIRDRIVEHKEASKAQQETEDRVAAAVLTTGYIADLLPSVLKGLKDGGYLLGDAREDIEGNFMDWLMQEVKTEMQKMVENRDLLTEMLREILETRAEIYHDLFEQAAKKRGHDSEDEVTPSESQETELVVGEESLAEEQHGEEVILGDDRSSLSVFRY
ncbi:radial spoke head protein 3 homolog isoform X2 [Halyomorpha halys]|uniref:radial spoke head protein 3 homolog isoform X2 n=1 Tax=Halyomorpha halys TaxID=286706 RepID=UPI0034D2F762